MFGELYSSPLRNGVSYPSRSRGEGVPMVNMREMFAFDRIADQECERVPLTQKEVEAYSLSDYDLLFARQSLTYEGAGKCVLVLPASEPRTWESHVIRVRLDRKLAWPPFYYYFFRSPQGRRLLETIIQQVAAAGIRGSDLSRLSVPKPALVVQQRIAEVLTALDDKIAVNERVLSLLDEWIRTAFDGLQGPVRPLRELAINVREQRQPRDLEGGSTYVGLEHLPRRRMWASSVGDPSNVTSAKFAFDVHDVLFGKLRPYFHKVVSAGDSGVCSTDILVVRAERPEHAGFVLAACASDKAVRACVASSEGTRMPRSNWEDLGSVNVAWPGDDAVCEFSAAVYQRSGLAHSLISETRLLVQTRNELLPLLMSGGLRVKDAEKVAGEVV